MRSASRKGSGIHSIGLTNSLLKWRPNSIRIPEGCGFAHVFLLYGFPYAHGDLRSRVRICFLLLISVETQTSCKLILRNVVAINILRALLRFVSCAILE